MSLFNDWISFSVTNQHAAVFARGPTEIDACNSFRLELVPLLGFVLAEDGIIHPALGEGDGLLSYVYNLEETGEDTVPGFMGFVDIAATDSEVFDVLSEGLCCPHQIARMSAFLSKTQYKPSDLSKRRSVKKGKNTKKSKKKPFKLTRELLLHDGFVWRNPAVQRAFNKAHNRRQF